MLSHEAMENGSFRDSSVATLRNEVVLGGLGFQCRRKREARLSNSRASCRCITVDNRCSSILFQDAGFEGRDAGFEGGGPLGPLGFNSPNIAQRHALHVERTASDSIDSIDFTRK